MINTFISTSEQKILSLMAMNPDQTFYTRQMSKKLGISLGATHSALRALENKHMLTSQSVGKTKTYKIDVPLPILQAFRVLNTLLNLEPVLRPLREISRRIILYGSFAEGTFGPESDLDLLLVAENKRRVSDLIEDAKRKTGLDIRPLIMNQLEWMNLEKTSPEFYDELTHGITLWERQVDESRF
jgi:predicted nucleotidyltransferase